MPAVATFLARALTWAVAWALLTPLDLFAWGPGTHVAIGEAVLSSAHLLPPAIRATLERFRVPFLYGSVAADISFAKKYAPVGRHCHHWHVGEEILASADTEEMNAVGLGYLAHLAADTIAHNVFVPRRLLLTPGMEGVGHTYWEHRMDVHLGERFTAEARKVVLMNDHAEADRLFDEVLSRTLFSFNTNRRIFRGMVAFQDDARWQKVFARILKRSRFDLPEMLRDRYLRLSYEYVMDYLARGDLSLARGLDPIGEMNLKLAKTVRRRGLARGGAADPELLDTWADEFFPLPGEPLLYLPKAAPLEIPGLRLPSGRLVDVPPSGEVGGSDPA